MKKPLTEEQFLKRLERMKSKPATRELFRPPSVIPDRKKEESRSKCRRKPPKDDE